MAKTVLVMDMPDYCNECYAMNMSLSGCFCRAAEESLPAKAERPDWCPLVELPEKKKADTDLLTMENGIVEGWNACLDEILKES